MNRLPESVERTIETGNIPSPPEVLLRLMRTVDDDQATVSDLAEIVGQDPGLACRILSVANSPALRTGKELKTLENCLIALGTRLVRSLATCLSIQRLFEKDTKFSASEIADFWTHSLLVGELARGIAEQADFPNPDDAYLSGLLHDVGELILLQAIGNPYRRYLANVSANPQLVSEEVQLFGTTHSDVGSWLLDHWKLDSVLADGVAFHHTSADLISGATTLPQIIWLAQALTSLPDESPVLGQAINGASFKINKATLFAVRERALERTRQIAEAMGLEVSADFPKRSVQQQEAPVLPGVMPTPAEDDLSIMVGGMALLQPLQQDLFSLGSDKEVLLALRESARILFELPKVAILLTNEAGDALTGEKVGAQPELFRQLSIPLQSSRSLISAAVMTRQVRTSFESSQPLPLLDLQVARALSAEGVLCIPMLARQRSIGVMVCGLTAKQYARLQRRIPWLANFGKIAAISLDAVMAAEQQRQRVEAELTQQFNQHARQIVHEAGNPLGIIKSYLKILERKLPEEGVRQELGVLTEEIDRVANIVGHMTNALRAGGSSKSVDLVSLLRDLQLLYADTLFVAKGIRVETQLPDVEISVQVNRDNLKQIILNLCKNASEALAAGKTVKITLTDNLIQDGIAYVQLRIDDNGPGIPEDKIQALYRPKSIADSRGRGIGLSVIGSLARQEKIRITCRSQLGAGTSIALLIPKVDCPESSLEPDA